MPAQWYKKALTFGPGGVQLASATVSRNVVGILAVIESFLGDPTSLVLSGYGDGMVVAGALQRTDTQ